MTASSIQNKVPSIITYRRPASQFHIDAILCIDLNADNCNINRDQQMPHLSVILATLLITLNRDIMG